MKDGFKGEFQKNSKVLIVRCFKNELQSGKYLQVTLNRLLEKKKRDYIKELIVVDSKNLQRFYQSAINNYSEKQAEQHLEKLQTGSVFDAKILTASGLEPTMLNWKSLRNQYQSQLETYKSEVNTLYQNDNQFKTIFDGLVNSFMEKKRQLLKEKTDQQRLTQLKDAAFNYLREEVAMNKVFALDMKINHVVYPGDSNKAMQYFDKKNKGNKLNWIKVEFSSLFKCREDVLSVVNLYLDLEYQRYQDFSNSSSKNKKSSSKNKIKQSKTPLNFALIKYDDDPQFNLTNLNKLKSPIKLLAEQKQIKTLFVLDATYLRRWFIATIKNIDETLAFDYLENDRCDKKILSFFPENSFKAELLHWDQLYFDNKKLIEDTIKIINHLLVDNTTFHSFFEQETDQLIKGWELRYANYNITDYTSWKQAAKCTLAEKIAMMKVLIEKKIDCEICLGTRGAASKYFNNNYWSKPKLLEWFPIQPIELIKQVLPAKVTPKRKQFIKLLNQRHTFELWGVL